MWLSNAPRSTWVSGQNREPGYLAKNPHGTTPALELDDGEILAEITAICEYIEELHPDPPLIGATPEERAKTRMWVRRIDLNIVEPMTNGFRYAEGLAMFKDRVRCLPQAAGDLKTTAQEKLTWLDGLIAGHTWVAGDRFTLADILPLLLPGVRDPGGANPSTLTTRPSRHGSSG